MSDPTKTDGESAAQPAPAQVDAQPVQPNQEVAPAEVDLSSWGENFKDVKVPKDVADLLPSALKAEHLKNAENLKFLIENGENFPTWQKSESGWLQRHNQKSQTLSQQLREIEKQKADYESKVHSIQEREMEIAKLEGDSWYYRDPTIRQTKDVLDKKIADGVMTPEEAGMIINPLVEKAKADYQAQKTAEDAKLQQIIEENSRIGKETFPEFDPDFSENLIDGFVMRGRDAKQAAEYARSEINRVIEAKVARALLDYKKSLGTQPPATEDNKEPPILKPDTTEDTKKGAVMRQAYAALWKGLGGG